MSKIIITGGAGFIGSAIVCEFNSRGIDDILIVDELGKTEKWRNLVNLKFADFVHKDDFISQIEMGQLDNIDGIIHMGACSDTTQTDADFLLWNNYEYTKILAKWCIEHNKRFVYASSAATYGDGSLGFSDRENIIPNLHPLNIYAYSKQLFDLWALRNGLLDKIAGLKYFNVFGPNEYHKDDMRSVIHKAFEQISSTGKLKLFKSYDAKYSDGGQMRDFVYIEDAVDMTIYLYEHPKINGIFNCGTGNARTFKDLANAVFAAMDKPKNIEYIDMPDNLRDKYQYFTQADMDKIRKIGYSREFTSLENAIADYVKNYLMTDDRYFKLKSPNDK